MAYLQFNNVVKKHDSRKILDNVSFAIKKGSITCIIGPSGSGKSTILKCLNLLEPIDTGKISFNDKIIAKNERICIKQEIFRQKIGIVFQGFNLWPRCTVLQNLILAPVLTKKLDKNHAVRKAKQVLRKVKLGGYEGRLPETLSGGERQRVAIARALMMDYEVLLLDEITSSLDPESVAGVLNILYDLSKSGVTLIFVTHHIEFAKKVGGWVVMTDNGRVVEQGQDVITNPKKERTREFLKHLIEAR